MPEVPSICERCGRVVTSGIVLENSIDVTITNSGGERCACGGTARIPDGLYSASGSELTALLRPGSARALRGLMDVLGEASRDDVSRDELIDRVSSEAPEFERLVADLPADHSQMWAKIQVLIALAALIISLAERHVSDSPTQSITVEEVVTQVVNEISVDVDVDLDVNVREQVFELDQLPEIRHADPDRRPGRSPARNAPCPCGSGDKYKRCHGR